MLTSRPRPTGFLPPPKPHPLVALVRRPAFWVWVLILVFTVWFSAYSFRLHAAHLTYKSDLGQMDLAIWNTAHGRFVQEIKADAISTRLTDHVEPIFLLVSAFYWLWDDVRVLFLLQAAALALGAWPIYLLARRKIAESAAAPPARMAEKAGLVFAVAYLLTPALQAPAAAEFHALPLAVPLIAWALWAVEDRRWIRVRRRIGPRDERPRGDGAGGRGAGRLCDGARNRTPAGEPGQRPPAPSGTRGQSARRWGSRSSFSAWRGSTSRPLS